MTGPAFKRLPLLWLVSIMPVLMSTPMGPAASQGLPSFVDERPLPSSEGAASEQEAAEDARRKAEEESARKRAAEEERARQAAEDARRKAEEESARKRAAEEERARKAAEDARRKAEEESARKRAAEEERARKAAEDARRKAEEESARKRAAEEERARQAAEDARRKAEEEAARKRAEEERARQEDARRKAEEEAARKRAAEEERARQAAEDARRKAEEEAARKRAAEEEAARKRAAEQERARRAAEEARLKAEEDARQRAATAARAAAARAAAERRKKNAAAGALAERMSGSSNCTDLQLSSKAQPAARIQIDVSSVCLAGRLVTMTYGRHEFVRQIGSDGRLTVLFDLFEGSQPMSLKLDDGSTRQIATTGVDFNGVSKVAVLWTAPVNLDLHAHEYLAPRGSKGHVWSNAPGSLDASLAAANEGDRGRGFISMDDDGTGPGSHAEVYTFLHNSNQRFGAITLLIDYETRGNVPRMPHCDGGELAQIVANVVRLRPGGRVEREIVRLGPVPCGQTLAEERRFNSDTLSDLVARN